MLNFARLQTPPNDGDTLIQPPLPQWPALIEANARLRAGYGFRLAGMSAAEAMARAGEQLPGGDGPRIACGHQPAFVHAGVWAKHAVVRHIQNILQIPAFDLVVDNDAPPSGALVVPFVDDGYVATRELNVVDGPDGSAYEGRPAIRADRLAALRDELAGLGGLDWEQTLLPEYLAGLAERIGAADFVEQHVHARARLDATLGVDLPELRVSRVFGGPFVADLLLNAERFAADYNAALAEYRRNEGVRSPDRPLPDLARVNGRIETALWIYKPLDRRRRLYVQPGPDRLTLLADGMPVGEVGRRELERDADAALAALRPWVVRPRALTLTLWARLLACDLFVHGIGGAKYDRITDAIIRRYYGVEPPGYACATATLRLPLPRYGASAEDVRRAAHALRDVRFNPQRYCRGCRQDLLAGREEAIRRSAELRAARAGRLERREAFLAIRRANAALLEGDPEMRRRVERDAERIRRELASDQAAASREYFYVMHSRGRLERLAEDVRRST